ATGIEIHRAEEPFQADNAHYPAGTHILYGAQPYRAHLNDMLELQVYPDRSRTPGGPAEPPYDIAGWTLPLQMGVRHVAVSWPFEARATKLAEISAPASPISGPTQAQTYVVPNGSNDVYRLANRLRRAGIEHGLLSEPRGIQLFDGHAAP